MPTAEDLESLRKAEEQMNAAEQELRMFIQRPDRFSPEGMAQHKQLVDSLTQRIAEYLEAFDLACQTL